MSSETTPWRPIAAAPKDGSWIVVTSTWNQYYRAAVQWEYEQWIDVREDDHSDDMLKVATHWMPLPLPPCPPESTDGQS